MEDIHKSLANHVFVVFQQGKHVVSMHLLVKILNRYRIKIHSDVLLEMSITYNFALNPISNCVCGEEPPKEVISLPVVYFDQQMHALARVCIVKKPQKHDLCCFSLFSRSA